MQTTDSLLANLVFVILAFGGFIVIMIGWCLGWFDDDDEREL